MSQNQFLIIFSKYKKKKKKIGEVNSFGSDFT